MSRVKLRDIADYTGTAISTVSAALNGTGRVSPDKAKQIREAAEKLGYDRLALFPVTPQARRTLGYSEPMPTATASPIVSSSHPPRVA